MDMAEMVALQRRGETPLRLPMGDAQCWHSPRAAVKSRMVELEERIAGSEAAGVHDLVELAAVGAAVAQSVSHGGRWLQGSRAERLVESICARIRAANGTRAEDHVKLVLAAAVASRDMVQAPSQALWATYQAAMAHANEHVTPGLDALIELALAGAAWAQAGPVLTLSQVKAKRDWVRERVLAYRSPHALDFIELTVLEVATEVAVVALQR